MFIFLRRSRKCSPLATKSEKSTLIYTQLQVSCVYSTLPSALVDNVQEQFHRQDKHKNVVAFYFFTINKSFLNITWYASYIQHVYFHKTRGVSSTSKLVLTAPFSCFMICSSPRIGHPRRGSHGLKKRHELDWTGWGFFLGLCLTALGWTELDNFCAKPIEGLCGHAAAMLRSIHRVAIDHPPSGLVARPRAGDYYLHLPRRDGYQL